MSRHGTLLPIPDEPVFGLLVDAWPAMLNAGATRSVWLRTAEDLLQTYYPASSLADRKLTARHLAPFPLALGPNVV